METTSKFQVESTNTVSTLFRHLDAHVEPTFAKRRQNNVDIKLSTLSTYFQPNFDVETTSYARWELTTYLKDLPLQSVSSKKNLQVVDKFRKTCELFLCSKNKRGRVGVQIPCIPFFVRWFTWNLFL